VKTDVSSRPYRILISAVEASSDLHASRILIAWLKDFSDKFPERKVELFGIGGTRLRAIPGFECIEPAESLAVMGFSEVLSYLPKIMAAMRRLVGAAFQRQPDLVLVFDYPDFHFRFLKKIAKLKSRKIYAIPPKIWVWRKSRMRTLHKLVDGVVALFPFEQKMYQAAGLPVIFEGNPLVDVLPIQLARSEARSKLGLDSDDLVLTIMPGSRDSELKQHVGLFASAARKFSAKLSRKVTVLVPFTSDVAANRWRNELIPTSKVEFRCEVGSSHLCLKAADLALVKSGTSVLESVLLDCPTVAAYRVSKMTEYIFRYFIRYVGPVTLPNILLGIRNRKESIIPELLGPEATENALADQLFKIHQSNGAQQKSARAELIRLSGNPGHVCEHIAEKMLSWTDNKTPEKDRLAFPNSSFGTYLISFLWSCLNASIRFLRNAFGFRDLRHWPTLVVGNIQAGGAGKSPIVREICLYALAQGKKVAMISRGHGRKSRHPVILKPQESATLEQVGDEVCDFRNQVNGAWIAVGAKRKKLAAMLPKDLDLIVLDDGFQSYRARASLVCVTDRTRFESVFRDFQSALRNADVVIQTKGDPQGFADAFAFSKLVDKPAAPIVALLSVGDPIEVVREWRKQGVRVLDWATVPDHSLFSASLIQQVKMDAAAKGAEVVWTTKDAVKAPDSQKITVLRSTVSLNGNWIQSLLEKVAKHQ